MRENVGVFFLICGRRKPRVLFEQTGKIICVCKSYHRRNFSDRKLILTNELFGILHFQEVDVFYRRYAVSVLELLAEISVRKLFDFCQLADINVFIAKMILYISLHLVHFVAFQIQLVTKQAQQVVKRLHMIDPACAAKIVKKLIQQREFIFHRVAAMKHAHAIAQLICRIKKDAYAVSLLKDLPSVGNVGTALLGNIYHVVRLKPILLAVVMKKRFSAEFNCELIIFLRTERINHRSAFGGMDENDVSYRQRTPIISMKHFIHLRFVLIMKYLLLTAVQLYYTIILQKFQYGGS